MNGYTIVWEGEGFELLLLGIATSSLAKDLMGRDANQFLERMSVLKTSYIILVCSVLASIASLRTSS